MRTYTMDCAKQVIECVCREMDVYECALHGKGLHSKPLRARRVCIHLMRRRCDMTWGEISTMFDMPVRTVRAIVKRMDTEDDEIERAVREKLPVRPVCRGSAPRPSTGDDLGGAAH